MAVVLPNEGADSGALASDGEGEIAGAAPFDYEDVKSLYVKTQRFLLD